MTSWTSKISDHLGTCSEKAVDIRLRRVALGAVGFLRYGRRLGRSRGAIGRSDTAVPLNHEQKNA